MTERHAASAVLPPPTFWDVEGVKARGHYFWLQNIQQACPDGHVRVEHRGEMLMLGSYSYLGLNQHPRINAAAQQAVVDFGTGTHGSRFLSGTLSLHSQLERGLADFKHTEDAVYFSSGYVANVSAISCLMREGDFILADRLNHASVVDGCLRSRARVLRYRHNDAQSLDKLLRKCPASCRKLVVADAVFSMDGDILDLPAISQVCHRHGAYLMVDECHSVGVLGATGRGIEEHFKMPEDTIDIKMGTLSKAIPSAGGYVAGSKALCNYLRHEARGFLYSGSPPAATVAAALEGLRILRESPEPVRELNRKSEYFKKLLRGAGLDLGVTQTPIVPIIVGSIEAASEFAKYCQEHGLFLHAIYPPVVPTGTARLRATVIASHSDEDLENAAAVLIEGARWLRGSFPPCGGGTLQNHLPVALPR